MNLQIIPVYKMRRNSKGKPKRSFLLCGGEKTAHETHYVKNFLHYACHRNTCMRTNKEGKLLLTNAEDFIVLSLTCPACRLTAQFVSLSSSW